MQSCGGEITGTAVLAVWCPLSGSARLGTSHYLSPGDGEGGRGSGNFGMKPALND